MLGGGVLTSGVGAGGSTSARTGVGGGSLGTPCAGGEGEPGKAGKVGVSKRTGSGNMAVATADRPAPEDGACGSGGAAFGGLGLAAEALGAPAPEVAGCVVGGVGRVGALVLADMTRVCKEPNLVDVASMRQRLSLAESKKPRCNKSTKTLSAQIFARLGKLMPSALKSMSNW